MSFTTPAFIRRNTPELREKLEQLGYGILSHDKHDVAIYTKQFENGWFYVCTPMSHMPKEFIDCGSNEPLFLALSALRSDGDANQWFTNGSDWILFRGEGTLLNYEHPSMEMLDDDVNRHFHKATPEELITHFKVE